jgi:hypothetical protein
MNQNDDKNEFLFEEVEAVGEGAILEDDSDKEAMDK